MVIDKQADPVVRLRSEHAALVTECMTIQGVTRKELRRRLADLGYDVTEQAIGTWLRGQVTPTPHHQAAIAKALNVPHRSLFPAPAIEAAS